MTSNFEQYQIILQARKSKKFKALDDKVRTMAIELGKGNKSIDKQEYQILLAKRDQELQNFQHDVTPTAPTFNKSIYQKIDNNITKKLNVYMEKFPNTKLINIVFSGATGTGKTYCAKYIEHELTQKGFKVYFTTTFNLVKRMNDNFYGQDNAAPTDLFDSDLLIIDDLGAEPSMKNSDELIGAVINERYAGNKAFIITTNLSKEQVAVRYGDRLLGRIYDKTRTAAIQFNGKDLRIE